MIGFGHNAAMADPSEPVLHLWQAIGKRDWEAVRSLVSDDCIFLDMPFGPTLAARGPENIVKRLKGGLENEKLANWADRTLVVLTNGVDVMYEHVVTYTSTDGETTNNPIVSVHKVSEGKVCLWKDYWDFNAIGNATWFQSSLEGADLSWVFDASGLI
jgi:limonene-1,2-epoxide hydrolase